ncbi:MAG: aminoacyl-tRNA hydrolase [Bacteroidales bacterium]|nr:aminoacyl-tRNA hydrolase [Bacteroidales bacterium]
MKYLIAGLGNIGDEYANTRHNIGFIVADALAQEAGAAFKTDRYADVSRIKYRGKTLVVIKPSTYMNLSGKALRYWMDKENIPAEQILVVTDDIALPTGTLRMRKKGGHGGHNGLESIILLLGTENFPRLRVGIGNDFARGYQSDYVLGKWTREEEELMIPKIKSAITMVQSFIARGIDQTMTDYNNR